jgi:hypothetical protein
VQAQAGRDPCEVRYEVDIPLIGVTEVGLPIERATHDAIQSAVARLPQYLPQVYDQATPYIDDILAKAMDRAVRTAEYEADYLADKMMEEKVMPRVETLKENLVANVGNFVEEILVTVVAVGAASIIAVGVGAWWVNRREEIRDKRG